MRIPFVFNELRLEILGRPPRPDASGGSFLPVEKLRPMHPYIDKTLSAPLKRLQREIIACRACPRLVNYIASIREKYPDFWNRPVPLFGDARAKILLLGLAPGRKGSNRTGRMFTGDASGNFLYPALHELGLATQPNATAVDDRLRLTGAAITAVCRCAPPGNKPAHDEIKRCAQYVKRELALLTELRVAVAFGKIAHDAYLKLIGEKLAAYPFKHGAVHRFDDKQKLPLVDCYHPSRQNTQTGLLTRDMFLSALRKAVAIAKT